MTAPSATQQSEDASEPMNPEGRIPRHVAVIMDGNRRWARQRGVPEAQGHAAGVEAIRPIVEHAVELGIAVLTIYAFSRENWQRSSHEVETLIGLLEATIRDETPKLLEEGVQVRLAGRLEELGGSSHMDRITESHAAVDDERQIAAGRDSPGRVGDLGRRQLGLAHRVLEAERATGQVDGAESGLFGDQSVQRVEGQRGEHHAGAADGSGGQFSCAYSGGWRAWRDAT